MIRATAEELASTPVGRFVVGETFVHFCAAPELWGIILWGRPDEANARELGKTLVLSLAPPAVPHVTIIDARHLDGGDPAAFRAAERYVTRYGDLLSKFVTRLAMIRPPGLSGATVAGAYEVLPRPYPVATFDDPRAAFEWLAPAYAERGPALLEELYAEASGTPPLLGALRDYLETHLADAEIANAATALGVSPRTLQRKLGAEETTFKRELAEARVRVAKRKLIETDAPLTSIAFDVGCASLQHFSALFRSVVNESPSAFRARAQRMR